MLENIHKFARYNDVQWPNLCLMPDDTIGVIHSHLKCLFDQINTQRVCKKFYANCTLSRDLMDMALRYKLKVPIICGNLSEAEIEECVVRIRLINGLVNDTLGMSNVCEFKALTMNSSQCIYSRELSLMNFVGNNESSSDDYRATISLCVSKTYHFAKYLSHYSFAVSVEKTEFWNGLRWSDCTDTYWPNVASKMRSCFQICLEAKLELMALANQFLLISTIKEIVDQREVEKMLYCNDKGIS